jgi:NDP-sugar pyrophosphorylase family protein
VVSKRVFADLPDNTPAETVREIYRDLVAHSPGRVRVFPVDATFFDVGTPDDYVATCAAFGGTDVGGNVIWPGASIAPGAQVTNCIVAASEVPSTTVADRSVLWTLDRQLFVTKFSSHSA